MLDVRDSLVYSYFSIYLSRLASRAISRYLYGLLDQLVEIRRKNDRQSSSASIDIRTYSYRSTYVAS